MKKFNIRLRILLRNSHIDKNDNLREIKKYLIRANNDFHIDREKEYLEKIFHKITFISKIIVIIVKKIIYVISINRITISSIIDIFILIIRLKLEIDISGFIYFNYEKSNHVRKNYNA